MSNGVQAFRIGAAGHTPHFQTGSKKWVNRKNTKQPAALRGNGLAQRIKI
jgi:hypothetical protein